MNIHEFIEELGEEILIADGFDEAFLGVASQFNTRFAVYDRDKCIEILQRDMSEEEAEEYFQYNVEGAYVGENTPAFLIRYEKKRNSIWYFFKRIIG